MANSQSRPSTYEVLRKHGIDRREFLRFCTATAATMGLEASMVPAVVAAMETKPRIPVIWLHGLECTCCSESFIRSSHPILQDVVFNMVSLDYDDLLQAAAGHDAEAVRQRVVKEHAGEYLLAVEGNAPTKEGGIHCTVGGESFLTVLRQTAERAKAILAWGSCASNGCVQAARPNPTGARPVHELLPGRTVIRVPGCPPIAEVMTGVLTYLLTFGSAPELDQLGRPKMFYGRRVHDNCQRRAFFDAGRFVEKWDDPGAHQGWCLYKMGCRGPVTSNSCAQMRWNGGVSFPIASGHGCLGCSEPGCWDNGSLYQRLPLWQLHGAAPLPEVLAKTADEEKR